RSRSALRETTGQLTALREAEVVDAGSTGIVELFDLLYVTVTGRTPQESMLTEVSRAPKIIHEARAEELEIVAILSAAAPDGLAAELDRLGGRSIVINDRKVHVHVDDETAAAVEFGGESVRGRSEEHTSELQSRFDLVCRLLLEKKK